MRDILSDLQLFAEVEAMPCLSEALADAQIYLAMERRRVRAEEAADLQADPAS